MKSSPRSPQLEKARVQQWRPNADKINEWMNEWKKERKVVCDDGTVLYPDGNVGYMNPYMESIAQKKHTQQLKKPNNPIKKWAEGYFPDGTVVKNPPVNAGDMGSSPGLGRSHMLQSN